MHYVADYVYQVFAGRTIYRILANWALWEHARELSGEVVDLAGNKKASYYRYLPKIKVLSTNYQLVDGVDQVVDLNQSLPFVDGSIKNILFFNAIYIIRDRHKLWRELFRVLSPGGKIYLISPFIANEMPEPDDFCRLTAQGLSHEASAAGFAKVDVVRFGERGTAAAYLLHPFMIFNIVRCAVYFLAMIVDRLIPRKVKEKHPVPLGYLCLIQK